MAGILKAKTGFRGGRNSDAVTENIELLTGQRGDGMDQAVTYRGLAELGMISLKRLSGGSYKAASVVVSGSDDSLPVSQPTQPQNVTANGGFNVVLVEWDRPGYQGHAHAEVWRSTEDNLSTAVLVGTTAANLYSDAIGKGMQAWYWVRFVNRNNVRGAYNAEAGTFAETAVDVQQILDALQGKIEYSHLAKWLASDITTQAEVAASLSDTITALDAEMRESGKLILSEYRSTIDSVSGLLERLEAMRLEFQAGVSAIYSEQIARVTQDQALAAQTSSLQATFGEGLEAASSQISELTQVVADEKESTATRFTSMKADYELKIGNVSLDLSAAVESFSEAVSSESESRASNIDTVTAEINGVSSAVQEISEAVATINEDGSSAYQAMWGAKATVGDISAGIGILADSEGNSQVMVSASQFYIFDPNGDAPTTPIFAIDDGKVIIGEALIRRATIQIIHAEELTADYVNAGVSLSAPVIEGGQITIGNNFLVDENGNMTAWSATLRYVTSNYGTFNYATINYATMRNCVIEEDCVVKGTVYADKIVGGVITERDFTSTDVQSGFSTDWQTALSFNITRSSLQFRRLRIIGTRYSVYVSASPGNTMSYTAYWRIQYRGITMSEGGITASATGGIGGDYASKSREFNDLISVAAQTTGQVTLQFRFPDTNAGSGGSSGNYTGGQVTARLFIDSEEMSAA